MVKVLITGANGFVGREIVNELAAQSFELSAFGRSKNANKESIKPENYHIADISDAEKIEELTKKFEDHEIVIHCAGLAHQFGKTKKEEFWKVNVTGTENVARLAAKISAKRFILISSVAVYGEGDSGVGGVNEESVCRPKDFYAQSKLESEKVARAIFAESDTSLTILRPATVIGEGDRGNFLRLIEAINNKRFLWIGNGENHKSLIHKTDVARACLRVLKENTADLEVFNIAAHPLTMRRIVDQIAKNLERKIPRISIPQTFLQMLFSFNESTVKNEKVKRLSETIQKWVADDVYSAEKIKRIYQFQPEITAETAIEREVKWYLANK